MARSKSRRSNQKKANLSQSVEHALSSFTDSNANVEACIEELVSGDFESLLNRDEMEAALGQVDKWMTEVKDEIEMSECLEQKLDVEVTSTELFDQFETRLPDFLESRNGECNGGLTEHLSNFEFRALSQKIESNFALLESRLDQLLVSFESKLTRCCTEVVQQFDMTLANLKPTSLNPSPAHGDSTSKSDPASSTESSWESRKRKMLSDFGMSSEEIEQIVPVGTAQNSTKETTTSLVERPTSNPDSFEALHHSIETLDKIDSGIHCDEIDRLKEQLTAQLREAEVELSINRARLSKEWAALEQKASELNQRESALKSKYTDVESVSKKGLLDRITRHLSRKH